MKLVGDEKGIAALKALAERDKGYVKFLIAEAQSNTDLTAPFTDAEGHGWRLRIEMPSGNLVVEAKPGG